MIGRRVFLGVSASSGLGLMAAPAWAQAAGVLKPAGASVGETFVFSEWLSAMDAVVNNGGNPGDRAFWRAYLDAGAHLDTRPAADTVALVTLPAPGVELFAQGHARDLAALANDRLAARVASGNGKMVGLATVAASDPAAAIEAERALGKLGLAGLSIGANRAVRLDDRRLWSVYEVAQAAGAAVYLPTSYAPLVGDVPYRALGAPGILAGAAAESARHARQLIFGGVFDAFPKLNVVLGRLGEATPYWHTELVETYGVLKDSGAPLPKGTVENYFAQNIVLTTADIQSAETMQFCKLIVGGDRVMRSHHETDHLGWARARLSMPA